MSAERSITLAWTPRHDDVNIDRLLVHLRRASYGISAERGEIRVDGEVRYVIHPNLPPCSCAAGFHHPTCKVLCTAEHGCNHVTWKPIGDTGIQVQCLNCPARWYRLGGDD